MAEPSYEPSIEHEPHLRPRPREIDPSEASAEQRLHSEASRQGPDEAVEHTVWDEPALSPELLPERSNDRLTYAKWLEQRIAATPASRTWWVTLAVVLASGPWGVLGSLLSGRSGLWGIVAVTVAAPVTEELMKVAAALWVIEKRPYLFRMPFQILLCTLAGGLAFAFFENLMYLRFHTSHFHDAGSTAGYYAQYATWRWTVCTGLHATCSFFSGLGLARMWSHAVANRTRPQIAHAAPMIVAAMIGHGLYNAAVSVAELSGWLQF